MTQERAVCAGEARDAGGLAAAGRLNSSLLACALHLQLRRPSLKARLDYTLPGSPQQSLALSAKLVATRGASVALQVVHSPLGTSLVSIFQWTALPRSDLEAALLWREEPGDQQLTASLQVGELAWRVSYSDSLQLLPGGAERARVLHVSCPQRRLNSSLHLVHQRGESGQTGSLQAVLTPELTLGGRYAWLTPRPGELEASVEATLPGQQASLRGALVRQQALLRAQLVDLQRMVRDLHLTASWSDVHLQLRGEGALQFEAAAELQSEEDHAALWAQLTAGGESFLANITYERDRSQKVTAVMSARQGRQYGGSVEWLLEPEDKILMLDLQLEKKFSFLGQVRSGAREKGAEAVVVWDKDSHASQTASLLVSSAPGRARASLVLQRRSVGAEVNYTRDGVEAALQWSGGQEVRGRLVLTRDQGLGHVEASLTTPFTGLSAQSAQLDWRRCGGGLNLMGNVLWQDKKIELVADVRRNNSFIDNVDIGVDIQLTSSFQAFHNAFFRFSHTSIQGERKSTKTCINLNFNDLSADFTSEWNISNSETEGSIFLESPWIYLNHTKAEMKLVNLDSLSSVFVDLQWNTDVSATIYFSYDTKLQTNAVLKIRKPLTEYGELSAEIILAADESDFMLETHATMLPFETFLEINRYSNMSFSMRGLLSTPALGKWEVDIVSEGHYDGKIAKVLEVKKNGTSIARFDTKGKISQFRDTELYLTAVLPKNVFTCFLISRVESNQSKIVAQATWNEEKLEANISGIFINEDGKLLSEYDAVLSTSFIKQAWRMELSSKSEPGKHTIYLHIPGITSMSYNFTLESAIYWEIMLQLNSSQVNGIIAQRLQYSPGKDFLADFLAEFTGERLEVDYHCQMKAEKQSIVSSIVTPWTYPIQLEVQLEYTDSALAPSFVLKYGLGQQVKLKGDVQLETLRGLVQFRFETSFTVPLTLNITYNTYESFALAVVECGELRAEAGASVNVLGASHNINLHILTPFKSLENVTLYGSYEDVELETKITASARINSINVALSGMVSSAPEESHVFIKLTSSFVNFKILTVDCRIANSSFGLAYEHNDITVEMTGKYHFHRKMNGTVEVGLKYSSKFVEDVGISLWYDLENINVGFVAHENSKQIQAVVNSNERRTEMRITSPFKMIEDSSISVRHVYIPGQKLTLNVILNHNGNTLHAAGDVSMPDNNNNSSTASFEIRTPFKNFENLRMDCSFMGLLQNHKTLAVTLSKNAKRFDIASSLDVEDNQADLKLKLDTPFGGYESIVGGLRYIYNMHSNELNDDEFRVEGKMHTFIDFGGSKREVIVSLSICNNTGSANISTSFESFKSASLSSSFKSDGDKLSTNFQVNWNNNLISGNISSALGFFQSDIELNVATSFPDFENMMFRLGHDMMEKYKMAYTYIQLNKKNFTEVKVSGFIGLSSSRMTISARVPLNLIKTVFFEGGYNISSGTNKEFNLILNTENYNFEINLASNRSQATAQIRTPLDGLKNIFFSCSYQWFLPAVVSFAVKTEESRTLFDIYLHMTQNNIMLKLILPFRQYQKFDFISDFYETRGTESGFFISLAVLANSQKILDSNLRIILDWANKIGINSTWRTYNSKQVSISAWSTAEFPPSHVQLVATKENFTFASLEGMLEDVKDGGFTFRANSHIFNTTRYVVLQYYPKDILIKFTADMGVLLDRTIKIEAELNHKNSQILNVTSDIIINGEEKRYFLSCSYNEHQFLTELRTPIPGFEKIFVEGYFSKESQNNNTFKISAHKNEESMRIDIVYNMHVDYSYVLFSAQASFIYPENLSFNFQHNFQYPKKNVAVQLIVGSQLFTTNVSLSLGYLRSEVDVKISSPFKHFQNVIFESKYDISTRNKNFELTSDVNGMRFAEVMFGVDLASSVGSVTLFIKSPLEIKVKGNYDFSKEVKYYTLSSSVVVLSQALFAFSLEFGKNIAHGSIEAEILGKEFELQLEYENKITTKKLCVLLVFDKNISHSFNAILRLHKTGESEALVDISFPYSQSYVVNARWSILNVAHPTGFILIKWPEQQQIIFESSLALGSTDKPVVFVFTGNSSLETYGKYMYETKITISDYFKLDSSLSTDRQNVFSVNLHGTYSSRMNNVIFTIKIPSISTLHGQLGYVLSHEQKSISGVLEYGDLKTFAQISANFLSGVNFEANLELRAPNAKLSKIHFHILLNHLETQKNVQIMLEVAEQIWKLSLSQHSQQEFSFFMATPIIHFEDFNFTVRVSSLPQEPSHLEITLGSFLNITAKCLKSHNAVRVSFYGKFESYEPLAFEGLLTAYDEFHSFFTLKFNKKEILLAFNVNSIKQNDTVMVEMVLKCPWMENITIIGHFKNGNEIESQITLIKGAKISTVNGFLRYLTNSEGHSMVLNLFLDDLTTITAEIETGKSLSLHLWSKIDTYHIDLKITRNADHVTGNLYLRTPHNYLNEANGFIEIDLGTMDEPYAYLIVALQLDDRSYNLSTSVNYLVGCVSGNFTLLTPKLKLEKNEILFLFNGDLLKLEFQIDDTRLVTSLSHKMAWPVYSANLTLDLPKFEISHIAFSSYLHAQNLSFFVSSEMNSKEIISFAMKLIPEDFSLKLQTQFQLIPDVSVLSKLINDEVTVHQLNGVFKWKNEIISLETRSQISSNNSVVHALFMWNGDKKLDLSASYRATGTNLTETIETSFFVSASDKEFSSKLEIDLRTPGTIIANLVTLMPFKSFPDLRAVTNFHKSSNSLRGYVSLTSKNQTLSVRIDSTNTNLEMFEINAEVVVPIEEITPIEFTFCLQQVEWKNLSASLQVHCFSNEVHANVSYRLQNSQLHGSIVVDTPFFAKQVLFGGSFKHRGLESAYMEGYIDSSRVILSITTKDNKEKIFECRIQIPPLYLKDNIFTIIIEYGSRKCMYVSLNVDDHVGNTTVAFEVTQNNISLEAYINIPVLSLTHQLARLNIEFAGSRHFVELHYEHGDLIEGANLSFSMDRDMRLSGHIQSSLLGKKDITLVIGEKLDNLVIDFWKAFRVIFKRDSVSGSISLNACGQKHALSYLLMMDDHFKGSIYIESPYIINEKLSISAISDSLLYSSNIEVDINSGEQNCKTVVQSMSTESANNISITMSYNSKQIISSGINLESNRQQLFVDVSLKLFGLTHKVSVRKNLLVTYDTEVRISSPLLPEELVRGVLNVHNKSIVSFIGFGITKCIPILAVEAAVDSKHGSVHLNIESQMLKIFHLLSINGVFKYSDWRNIKINFDGQFASEMFPSIKASGSLKLNEKYFDASLSTESSFKGFDQLGCSIYIPLSLSFDFNPRVMLIFPSGFKYGLDVLIQFLSDEVELSVLANFRTDVARVHFITVYGSQGKLELEVNLPFLPINHFRLDLMGYRSLSDGTDTSNYIEWNDNRIEFKHAWLQVTDKVVLHLGLLTPFLNHNRYDILLHYENRESKVFALLFALPALGENIGINFNLLFQNILDFNFLGEVKLPISDGFETMSLSLKNKVESQEINSSFIAKHNEEEFKLSFASSFTKKQIVFYVNILGAKNKLALNFMFGINNDNKRQAFLELITPFMTLNYLNINITKAPYLSDGMTASITYNGEHIIGITLDKDIHSVRSLIVQTPWRSVSSLVYYQFEDEFRVNGELCWNVDKRKDSLIGLKINVTSRPENRFELSTEILIPSRTIIMDANYQVTPNKVEYTKRLSWGEGYNIGYHLLFDIETSGNSKQKVFIFRGDLPFRSFEIMASRTLGSSSATHVSAEILWDALGDRTKKMQVSLDAAEQRSEVSLHHPGLQSNLVLRVIQSDKCKIELEYSPVKENMFVAETYFGYRSDSLSINTHAVDAMFILQHNASKLNLQFGLEALITEKEVSGAISIKYKNSHREEMQILQMVAFARYEPLVAEMHLRTTGNNISASVSTISGLDGSRGLKLKTNVNKKQPLSLELRLNTAHPMLELELRSGENRSYNTYMGLPNRRQIVLGVRHSLDGEQTVDGLVALSLNSSRLLCARVQWRSESVDQVSEFLRKEYGDLPTIASSVAQHFSDFFEDDFAEKLGAMYTPVHEAYMYGTSEFKSTYADVRRALDELREMYYKDNFYLLSISTFLSESITLNVPLVKDLPRLADFLWRNVVAEPVLQAARTLSSAPAMVCNLVGKSQAWRSALRGALQDSREALLQLERVVLEALASLETAAGQFSRLAAPCLAALEHASEHISSWLERACLELLGALDSAWNSALDEEQLQMLAQVYSKYASWLEELHLRGHLDRMQDLAANYREALLSTLEGYERRLRSVLSATLLQLSALADLPEVTFLQDSVDFILRKAQGAWRYHDGGALLRAGLHNAVTNLASLLADLELGLAGGGGRLEFSQRLPFDWPGFDELPHFGQLAWRPPGRFQRLVKDPAPRPSTAVLVAGRRFLTFDGQFFDFSGNCSYVLAGNSVDSQYIVFITYRGKEGPAVRKSLMLMVDGRLIELGEDWQVRVDGHKTELPVAAGTAAQVWRRGDSVVVDALRHGLRLQCDLRLDACSLQVGDRHRGKVMGLLGAFQGDVATHARRWRINFDTSTGARCEPSGPEESIPASDNPQLVETCDQLFLSPESPLRPCYGVVKPEPFHAMCLVDSEEGGCRSASVYSAQCRAAGVHVQLPSECVRCALADGSTLRRGDVRLLDADRPAAADVVLVLEQAGCLAQLDLRELVEKLYAGLALRGLEQVRFSVVSFGPGQPPESHTARGQLWASHRAARATLRQLTFSNSTGGHGSNALEALRYATGLGFREGASRTVVLVQCGACRGQHGYKELVSQLLSRRATLHVLEPNTLYLANNSSKASKVYGIDKHGAFTGRSVRTLESSPALRRQVKLPKDQCTPAALETGGSLFNLARLGDAGKRFLDVWTRRVAAVRPALCRACECREDSEGVARAFCEDCAGAGGPHQ